MALRISDVLNKNPKLLDKEGAFNGFVDIDSKFYIDPRLLDISSAPELKTSRKTFEKYFSHIFTLLQNSKSEGDRFWRGAYQRLRFKEIRLIGLGYSSSSTSGNAIGRIYARTLVETSRELLEAGIKDPTIYELLGLFEEGIGADRISDATASIIFEDLINFSSRVTKKLKIKNTVEIKYNEKRYIVSLNPNTGDPIYLVPKDILTPLPIANSWSDIDLVCTDNQELRNKVNEIIGNTWKDATNNRKIRKYQLREILFDEPELLRDLINVYKRKPKHKYDFYRDPFGEIIWADIAKDFSKKFPLNLTKYKKLSTKNLIEIVKKICNHFELLIEDNGLNELLWFNNKLRHERFAQKIYFGIADSYCRANNLDLSPETNSGRGPVDFKISTGYNARVLVEVKYSSSSALVRGYTKQLPTYSNAEKSFHNIYLVIRTGISEKTIKTIIELRRKNIAEGKRAPEIIVVDGRLKKSASKL